MTDLVYAYIPCSICGQDQLPLKAWITPCDYDEDGHAHDFDIDLLECPKCPRPIIESCSVTENEEVEIVIREIMDAFWDRGTRRFYEIGTIYSYCRTTKV